MTSRIPTAFLALAAAACSSTPDASSDASRPHGDASSPIDASSSPIDASSSPIDASSSLIDASGSPIDATPSDAGVGVDGSTPGCAFEPQIERTLFIEASVAYLRTAFAVSSGFTGGRVAYGEAWVSLERPDCPMADWAALSYVVVADPSRVPLELRATHDRVAAVWTLGGRKFVVFLPSSAPADDAAPWQYGSLPDNVNAVLRADAPPAAVGPVVARIEQDRALQVSYLDAIGIVTVTTALGTFVEDRVGAATVPSMDAAAELMRASGLFDAIEWSGLVFRLPNEFHRGTQLDDSILAPECLRTETRTLRDTGQFTTAPSLAEPLGPGPVLRPECL